MKKSILIILVFVFLLSPFLVAVELSKDEALIIGKKIWLNECAGTVEGLTSWNQGENFGSFGIAHFIWFPQDVEAPFEESFPNLVAYIKQSGAKIPEWLLLAKDCPWNSREEFMAQRESEKMKSLRFFLRDTIALQAQFAAQRLSKALPKMTATLDPQQTQHLEKQFRRLAITKGGTYLLMDYVNFKGEGVKESERYQGEGWGLQQVLLGMKGSASGAAALDEFADSSVRVLSRRVELSPPARKEERWLKGWMNRCQTYRSDVNSKP
jgi:hypothetical protein